MRSTAIASDLWRLEVTLPGHSVGHVNSYALRGDEGILLIDTGWAVAESRAALEESLGEAGFSLSQVSRVLLTHVHADHSGMAGMLQREVGAKVGMHERDAEQFTSRFVQQKDLIEATRVWMTEANVPEAMRQMAVVNVENGKSRVVDCQPDELIADGQVISHGSFELVAFHTPPHTPGHLCFYDRTSRMLFTGDMILPRINHGASFRPLSSSNPFNEYVASLTRLATLDLSQILPGHLEPILDGSARIEELLAHHKGRLESVRKLVEAGAFTTWEVASGLSRSRRWEDLAPRARLLAVGEAYAYLRSLSFAGVVTGEGDDPKLWHVTPGS
jgi:glyoxylase-like metal-dependent hydrolase (beta-lactamase superfamily II)